MTRTAIRVLAVSLIGLMMAVIAAPVLAQTRQPSTPAGGKASAYGPSAAQPQRTSPQKGTSPVRRVAGEEPVREPVPGAEKARPAGPPAMPVEQNPAPRQPTWYPLASNVQQWVDEVLLAWEQTSEKVVTYKCKFQRWEFDPVFGPKEPDTPATYAEGIIQYAKPDKGLFKVEKLLKYGPPLKAGGAPQWLKQEIGEHWVCDGKSIFEFDARRKLLVQRILPKEMQGKAIADGPLPFLFGAKVTTIKARYWIQPLDPPKGREGEYWLEAVPRFRQDAANFQKVSIILDEKDFLPKALDVYAPNYNSKTNPAHTAYEFMEREPKTKSSLLEGIPIPFLREFYEPKVPSGWKKVVEDMNGPPEGAQPVQGPAPAQAVRPGPSKKK